MTSFSIITPTFNADASLDATLCSVSGQRDAQFEHLIVDGGSTDATLEIVNAHLQGQSPTLRLVCSESDRGIYDAWNRGATVAKGQWLFFLGADDQFVGTHVLSQIAARLERFPTPYSNKGNLKFVYGQTYFEGGEAEDIVGYRQRPFNFTKGETRFPTAVFIHRSLFIEGARFDDSYRICGDHKFFLEHAFYDHSALLDVPVLRFALGGVSSNARFEWLHFKERQRMLTELGYPRNPLVDAYLALRAALVSTWYA
jgi:glycosyltransferase involved in cell wall biosynthesis